MINDPLFGYISDHTRTRWGRRRPYLLFGPIPFAIVFTLMWWSPPIQGDVALVAYYAFIYVLYDAAATMIYMPYFALTPELTSDYDERTSLTSVRAFFSIAGSLVAFTIPVNDHYRVFPGARHQYHGNGSDLCHRLGHTDLHCVLWYA